MLKLNFALYTSKTLLRDWWKQVKTHLTQLQDAHNALETTVENECDRLEGLISDEVSGEATARQNVDSALLNKITTEENARQTGDSALSNKITAEENARQNAVLTLQGNISAVEGNLSSVTSRTARLEEKSGQCEDTMTELDQRAASLEEKAHIHENSQILSSITSDDIAHWNERFDYDSENKVMMEFLLELLKGYEKDFDILQGEMGVTMYDGGFYTDNNENGESVILDGGGFEEEDIMSVNCGEFGDVVYAAPQVLDGGKY